MPILRVERGVTLGAKRGETVVCVPVSGQPEQVEETFRSVSSHTAAEVRIVLCGSGDPGRITGVSGGVTVNSPVLTASESLSQAVAASAPADVVIVTPGCVVAEGWLEGLNDAAYAETTAATASGLPLHELRPPCELAEFDQAAATVRAHSARIRPRMDSPYASCIYIRRSALELVGCGELGAATDGYERGHFSRRCLESGLSHVLADEVLVMDRERGATASTPTGPWSRAIGVARRAVYGLSVVIDARIEPERAPGTLVHVLELIAAVVKTREVRVTAVVSPAFAERAKEALDGLAGVEIVVYENGRAATPPIFADLAHRPFQVATPADLAVLAGWAERVVVTHQDLISYRNFSYFRSIEAWQGYRGLTRRALASCDHVLFFSRHARRDALAEDLVEPHRSSVVHIGVNHTITRAKVDPRRPRNAIRLPERAEVLLCLGTDFRHKNRVFALRVVQELQRRHDWPGWLVLAGPHVALGSSQAEEQELLAADPRLRSAVIGLGAVSEAEKAWLLDRATLLIYPTVYEGFGLVPFDAAERGLPCLWADVTSLCETLPETAAGIVTWDAAATADYAIELMRAPDVRSENVQAVRDAAASLTWQKTAARLTAVYRATCDQPPAPAALKERAGGIMQPGFTEDAVRLVGPQGALPRDLERPLLALATHAKLAGPLFGAIKAGYRATYRWRRTRQ